MSTIDLAIASLENEMLLRGSPQPGSIGWFEIRGLSTGISTLKAIKAKGFEGDVEAVERYRKACRNHFVNELGAE